MKEILIRVKDEDISLVTQVLEKLGAEVTNQKSLPEKEGKKRAAGKERKEAGKISPTFLFGKWKDLEIDARKLREAAWDRSGKFL